MILSQLVERAIGQAPVAVMAYAALERALEPAAVDELFRQHAQTQYTRKLLLSDLVGIMAETMCRFHRSFAYPEAIDAGLRVGRLGKSSVRYEVGLFGEGEDEARVEGHLVHVFVERATNKPVSIPAGIRAALERLVVA